MEIETWGLESTGREAVPKLAMSLSDRSFAA